MQEAFIRGKQIQAEQIAQADQKEKIHEIGENLLAAERQVQEEFKEIKPKTRIIDDDKYDGITMPLPAGKIDEPILYAFIGVPKRKNFDKEVKVAVCVDMYDHETWSRPGSRPFHTEQYYLTNKHIFQADQDDEFIPIKDAKTTIALFQDIIQRGFYRITPQVNEGHGMMEG